MDSMIGETSRTRSSLDRKYLVWMKWLTEVGAGSEATRSTRANFAPSVRDRSVYRAVGRVAEIVPGSRLTIVLRTMDDRRRHSVGVLGQFFTTLPDCYNAARSDANGHPSATGKITEGSCRGEATTRPEIAITASDPGHQPQGGGQGRHLGELADDRRADQEAEVADRRGRRDPGHRLDPWHLRRRSEQNGHGVGQPQPDQGEPGRGHGRLPGRQRRRPTPGSTTRRPPGATIRPLSTWPASRLRIARPSSPSEYAANPSAATALVVPKISSR